MNDRATRFLSKYITVDNQQEILYMSCLNTPLHTFCLLHQNRQLHNMYKDSTKNYLSSGFENLNEDLGFRNAIIIDPWLYKATKLSNYPEHYNSAEQFDCGHFLEGEIEINELSFMVGESASRTPPGAIYGLKRTFNEDFHNEQTNKLNLHRNSFTRGRRYSDVRRSLVSNIQQQQLISFKQYIERLKGKSSSWYGGYRHSDTKGQLLTSVITYLETCIKNRNYPNVSRMENIFWSVLRILPIVRGSSPPKRLTSANVAMTKTAKGLFSTNVTDLYKQPFEDIEGICLQRIRNIRNSIINERERYIQMLNIVYVNHDNLESLYTSDGKAFYYSALHDAIND